MLVVSDPTWNYASVDPGLRRGDKLIKGLVNSSVVIGLGSVCSDVSLTTTITKREGVFTNSDTSQTLATPIQ